MEEQKRPLILVTNDDGITAKGIRTLTEVMCEYGEVVVVAPDSPQSGMGHAITIHLPLKVHKSPVFEDLGVEAWECSGTPADCVKLAKHYVLQDRRPDLVVSGINHGTNVSVSVLYSGTMSAAVEAALEGLPAIGFSLCNYSADADFEACRPQIRKVVENTLESGFPKGLALNVNIPDLPVEEIKGIRVCRQARATWEEKFDLRKDPYGREYLWLAGDFVNYDHGEDTDVWALDHGFVSLVPCTFDLTAHHALAELNDEWSL